MRTFLRFFRSKRDLALQTVEGEFDDAKSDNLLDDGIMFSSQEVEHMLVGLKDMVMHSVRSDLGRSMNMMALLLKQLLQSADEQGVQLGMNMSAVEDQALLDSIEKMSLDGPGGRRRSAGKLVSLKDEQRRLERQASELAESKKELESRCRGLDDENGLLRKERENLTDELASVRRQLNFLQNEIAEAKGQTRATLRAKGASDEKEARLMADLEEERSRRSEAERDMEQRLHQSRQVKQLKDMLQSKNAQIKEMRERLRELAEGR